MTIRIQYHYQAVNNEICIHRVSSLKLTYKINMFLLINIISFLILPLCYCIFVTHIFASLLKIPLLKYMKKNSILDNVIYNADQNIMDH